MIYTRCNLIRRDMPLVAWIELSGSLKRAIELRLFGDCYIKEDKKAQWVRFPRSPLSFL